LLHARDGGPAEFARIAEPQLIQIGLPLVGCSALTVSTGRAQGGHVGVPAVAAPFREDALLTNGEALVRGCATRSYLPCGVY
jgi:hypothetical protein